MKNILFILIPFVFSNSLFAQKPKVKKTTGEAQVTWTDDKSKLQVKEEAKQQAIINAIENAFGRVVIQGNATYINNVTTGEQVETQTRFNMIGNSMVKGELLEILDETYDELKGDGFINIQCKIKIKAREIINANVDYEAFTLSGNRKNNKTEAFYDGDEFYLYFRSPKSGYLTVYLDDTHNAYRILPYQNMPSSFEDGVLIESDKEYIFFSPEHSYFENDLAFIDELVMSAETQKDLNRLFLIFSKEPISKPILKKNGKQLEGDFSSPKEMTSEDFQKWKNKNQSLREDLEIKVIDVTIEKQ